MGEALMGALCRFCLSREKGLQPIFSTNTTILRKIADIIQLEVRNEDGLPSNICQHCVFQLNSAHRFKLRCSRTDAKLRAFVAQKVEAKVPLDLLPSDDESDSDAEFDLPICEVVYTEPQESSESKHSIGSDSKTLGLVDLTVQPTGSDHLPQLPSSVNNHIDGSDTLYDKDTKDTVVGNNIAVKEEPISDIETNGSRLVKEEAEDKTDDESNDSRGNSCDEQSVEPVANDNDKTAVDNKPKRSHKLIAAQKKKKDYKNLLVICEICGKLFKKNHLYYHRKLHTAERQHECNICHKSFKTVSQMMTHLKRHVRLHDGEKSFLCSYCGKSFIDSSNLRNHVRNHKQERNYTCVTCGKSFARAETLTKHLRSHTGEKPYTCEVCARLFPRKDSLIRHMKSHRGERPHKCDSCDRCFTQSYDLKLHRRKHAARQI